MDIDGNGRRRRWNCDLAELLNRVGVEGSDGKVARLIRRGFAKRKEIDTWLLTTLFLVLLFTRSTNAAYIDFENCLETNILNNPSQLQFVPSYFSVVYDPSPGPNPLDIVIYGNVTGNGEIVNIVDNNGNETYTTLFTTLDVLSFTPYDHATEFCRNLTQGSCPLGPVFNVNGYVSGNLSFAELIRSG